MRIEAYTQVQQLYQSSQKQVKGQKDSSSAKDKDKVQISSMGKDIQTAKTAVKSNSDIREELTAAIKAQIQNGTYEVSPEKFAEKLIGKYEEMQGFSWQV